MYQLGGGYPWDTTGISLQPGTILIYIFLIGTEKTAIKLSSDHFRIKGIAKRNKRKIIGPRKFAKYGHRVVK